MYFIEKYGWTQEEHDNFSAHQIYSALLLHEEKKGRVCWFWSALCPWCQRGTVTWCLNEDNGVIVFLMYLSVVVIKHHCGCHQVQRGRLLAIWCWVLSLMATQLIKMMATYLMKMNCVVMNLLNDVNLMYIQWLQKVMMEGMSVCARTWWKEYVSRHTWICLDKVAYARGNNVPSCVWEKTL